MLCPSPGLGSVSAASLCPFFCFFLQCVTAASPSFLLLEVQEASSFLLCRLAVGKDAGRVVAELRAQALYGVAQLGCAPLLVSLQDFAPCLHGLPRGSYIPTCCFRNAAITVLIMTLLQWSPVGGVKL